MPARSPRLTSGPHLAPIGPLPSAADLLVCALMYGASEIVLQIADYVDPVADLDEPPRSGYAAAVALARQHLSPAPQLVLDELRRTGRLDHHTARWLATAATAGAPPETARRYAAMVVANSARRQITSFGAALLAAADTAAEEELMVLIDTCVQTITATFARLAALRGGADD